MVKHLEIQTVGNEVFAQRKHEASKIVCNTEGRLGDDQVKNCLVSLLRAFYDLSNKC